MFPHFQKKQTKNQLGSVSRCLRRRSNASQPSASGVCVPNHLALSPLTASAKPRRLAAARRNPRTPSGISPLPTSSRRPAGPAPPPPPPFMAAAAFDAFLSAALARLGVEADVFGPYVAALLEDASLGAAERADAVTELLREAASPEAGPPGPGLAAELADRWADRERGVRAEAAAAQDEVLAEYARRLALQRRAGAEAAARRAEAAAAAGGAAAAAGGSSLGAAGSKAAVLAALAGGEGDSEEEEGCGGAAVSDDDGDGGDRAAVAAAREAQRLCAAQRREAVARAVEREDRRRAEQEARRGAREAAGHAVAGAGAGGRGGAAGAAGGGARDRPAERRR